MNKFLFTILFSVISVAAMSQVRQYTPSTNSSADTMSYLNPKDYIIGGITITGAQHLDTAVLLQISKLNKGDKINLPGEANASVIKNLYQQQLFDDVQLNVTKIHYDTIYLQIVVKELPRLSRIHITGIRKGEIEDINKSLADKSGKIVNTNLLNTTTAVIKKHYAEKGFYNATVTIKQRPDPGDASSIILEVAVNKNKRVMVNSITFEGNHAFSKSKLHGYLSKTRTRKFWNIFGSRKFKEDKYTEDKQNLITQMQDRGYRDAELITDSVWKHDDETVNIKIKLYEGPKYYFGNIKWSGNAKYTNDILNHVLKIKKGDVFSEDALSKRISGGADGDDISSLYMNEGYLTYNADPVQTRIYHDTVDLDIRMYEGPQYTINRVIVKGNDVTNDKVIIRELQTLPGQKFNKAALIESTRIIGQLGTFDDQKTEPKPTNLNPQDGTVDLLYNVVEKPSDQVELSGGYGGGQVVGTLGLTFNNFSVRNIFHLKDYKPLPKGDGEKLSLRGQTSGRTYQNYSFTYTNPWWMGKRPILLSISAFTQLSSTSQYYAKTDPSYNNLRINGVGITIGKHLKWPDNHFQLNYSLNLDHYNLDNYPGYLFTNGTSYNIKLTQEISRNSLQGSIYNTGGSNIRLTIQGTPPYSLFNGLDYKLPPTQEQLYHFVEYYKVKFDAQWFTPLVGKFVLMQQVRFGFLGEYNSEVPQSPFERFKVGGDGMQSYQFLQGSDIIGLRGYQNYTIIPVGTNYTADTNPGAAIYNKYTMELRHPVINSPSATIYLLAFAEGGNVWNNFSQFNPYNIRRSTGLGARIFLPIFGLIGLDYGYGFDAIPGIPGANKGQFSFSLAQTLNGGFN